MQINKLKSAVLLVAALASASVMPAHADSSKARVVDAKKLTAGIHNQAPWGYRKPDGTVKGFNVDVIRAVFTPLGVKEFNFITADFGSLIPGLISNRFDLVDSGVVITPERCKLVNFSEPELTSIDALLVKKGNPKNIHSLDDIIKGDGISMGGSRGSQQAKNAATGGVSGEKLQLFQNTESTISAIMAGRVDGVTFTSGTANALLASPNVGNALERATPFKGLTNADGTPVAAYIGTVFRKEDESLRDIYNQRLAEMKKDGTLAKIMAEYGFAPNEAAPTNLSTADICAGKV